MGKMFSSFWSESKSKPAEESPLFQPQSTGDGKLPSDSTQVGGSEHHTEPAADVPGQAHSKGDGVKLEVPERAASVLDQSYQRRPLQVKRRNRGPRARRPVAPGNDRDEEEEEEEETDPNKDTVQIHGLSVDRYREIYNSVLTPAALSALPMHDPAEYMTQVLELKQRLYAALYRPQLTETIGEDGRVHYTETYDLT